jgi:hypothetical protein
MTGPEGFERTASIVIDADPADCQLPERLVEVRLGGPLDPLFGVTH